MKSIGFTYRIPKYITDRQNYIGFTYKNPITYLYLFTVNSLWANDANHTPQLPPALHGNKTQVRRTKSRPEKAV